MRNLYFDDFEDLACDIADTYDALDYDDEEDVAIIAKYEEARQIIKELLCLGYDIHSVEIHDDLWENYDAEYVVSLYDNSVWCEPMLREKGYIDEEYGEYDAEYIISIYDDEIWCEPMLRENGYIEEDAPVIYVLDNCSSKVIPYCKGKTVYEVTVGDDDECSCDDCEEGFTVNGEPVSKEEFDSYTSHFIHDEKPTTTTSTKSVYKINNKEVSKEEFDKKYEEFEEMYLDNIRDMMLNYCSFMDEMNEWRSRFLRW